MIPVHGKRKGGERYMDEEIIDTPIEDTNEEPVIEIQDSILLLIKKKLGIAPDYHAFDEDIITDINTVLFSLNKKFNKKKN